MNCKFTPLHSGPLQSSWHRWTSGLTSHGHVASALPVPGSEHLSSDRKARPDSQAPKTRHSGSGPWTSLPRSEDPNPHPQPSPSQHNSNHNPPPPPPPSAVSAHSSKHSPRSQPSQTETDTRPNTEISRRQRPTRQSPQQQQQQQQQPINTADLQHQRGVSSPQVVSPANITQHQRRSVTRTTTNKQNQAQWGTSGTHPSTGHKQQRTTANQPRRKFEPHQQQQGRYFSEVVLIIKNAPDLQSLLEVVREQGSKLSLVSVVAAYLRFEQLCQRTQQLDSQGGKREMVMHGGESALVSSGMGLAARRAGVSQGDERHHKHPQANVQLLGAPAVGAPLAGAMVLDSKQTAEEVAQALGQLRQPFMGSAALAHLANMIWVCAKLQSHTHLWPALSEVVMDVTSQLMTRGVHAADTQQNTAFMMSSRYLSNLIYSLALLNLRGDVHVDEELLEWLQEKLMTKLHEANAQDLSNTAYALALLGNAPPHIWEKVCMAIANKFRGPSGSKEFPGQGMANIAWAIGKLGKGSSDVVPAFMDCLLRTPPEEHTTNSRDAANILWAAAYLGLDNREGWYTVRANLLTPLVAKTDMQLLSMATWACATAEVAPPAFFEAVVSVLKERRPWSLANKPMALVNLLWSLAKLDICDTQVFLSLQPVALKALPRMSPLEHQMLLWALGKFVDNFSSTEMTRYLDLLDLELTRTLIKYLKPRIPAMSGHEVGTLAAALTMLTWYDEDINHALTTRMMQIVDTITLPQMSTMLWYLSKIVVVETTPSHDHTIPSAPNLRPHIRELLSLMTSRLLDLSQEVKGAGMVKEMCRGLWCLAVMTPHDTTTISKLMQAVCAGSITDNVQLSMVAQALHAVCQLGHSDDDLSWIHREPVKSVVARAVTHYHVVAQNSNPSATQLQVYAELEHVPGVEARQLEVPAADGMFRIDILLRYRGVDLGIEVDGPFHYMMNRQGIVTGDTLFRNRLLASHGYRIVCLRASEITALGTIQRRTQLLGEVLQLALNDPAQLWHRDRHVGNSLRGEPVLAGAVAIPRYTPPTTNNQPPTTASQSQIDMRRLSVAPRKELSRGSGGSVRGAWQQPAQRQAGVSWSDAWAGVKVGTGQRGVGGEASDPKDGQQGGGEQQVSADDEAVQEAIQAVEFAGSKRWKRAQQGQRESAMYQRGLSKAKAQDKQGDGKQGRHSGATD